MKRANRPVPIQLPIEASSAASSSIRDSRNSFKLTDSGVWSEAGVVLSKGGARIVQRGGAGAGASAAPACAETAPASSASPQQGTPSSSGDGSGAAAAPTSAAGAAAHQAAGDSNSADGSGHPSTSGTGSAIALSDLQELAVIGSGSSGLVKKVLHRPTQQVYVLKVINMDMSNAAERRQVATEVRSLHGARHPHVVAYHQSYFSEGAVTILMEHMDGGSLWDLLQRIRVVPQAYLPLLARQVLLGLSFLHEAARICHRDVKPGNLLLSSDGTLKISDFGTSSQLSNSMSRCLSWVGTVTYMSPERIRGDAYSFNTDVWSLGLLLLECATGRFPYPPLPPQQQPQAPAQQQQQQAAAAPKLGFWELLEYIVVEPAPRLPESQFSPQLVDFVAQCLQKDPARRPSASQLLQHPFVADAGSSSNASLAELLKLPPVRPPAAAGASSGGGAAAGRGAGGLRRSGNFLPGGAGGLRGSWVLTGSFDGGNLRRSRNSSLSDAGRATAAVTGATAAATQIEHCSLSGAGGSSSTAAAQVAAPSSTSCGEAPERTPAAAAAAAAAAATMQQNSPLLSGKLLRQSVCAPSVLARSSGAAAAGGSPAARGSPRQSRSLQQQQQQHLGQPLRASVQQLPRAQQQPARSSPAGAGHQKSWLSGLQQQGPARAGGGDAAAGSPPRQQQPETQGPLALQLASMQLQHQQQQQRGQPGQQQAALKQSPDVPAGAANAACNSAPPAQHAAMTPPRRLSAPPPLASAGLTATPAGSSFQTPPRQQLPGTLDYTAHMAQQRTDSPLTSSRPLAGVKAAGSGGSRLADSPPS